MERVLAWRLRSLLSYHQFMSLPRPSLLKGPSDGRDRDTEQAPEINLVPALCHPYSSQDAFHRLPCFRSALALILILLLCCSSWKSTANEKLVREIRAVCVILPHLHRENRKSFFPSLSSRSFFFFSIITIMLTKISINKHIFPSHLSVYMFI